MTTEEIDARLVLADTTMLDVLHERIGLELARRAASGPTDPEVEPPHQYAADVKNGCVDQRDLGGYEDHRRGKNWIATVAADKTQQGGLRRVFWNHGSGSWRLIPAGLSPGDVLEVAHEYITGSGRNDKSRNYVRVVKLEAHRLLFDDCDKPE